MRPVKILFDPAKHEYTILGRSEPVRSVTQVLADAGMRPDGRFYAAGSADRGKAVHTTIKLYFDAKLAKKTAGEIEMWKRGIHPVVAPYFEAFLAFEREARFRAEWCEIRVYSAAGDYAGTTDLIGRIGGPRGKPVIIDTKTGVPEPWHRVQVMAYRMAIPRWAHRARYGLYLRKDGTYKLEPFRLDDSDQRDFLAALRVASWRRRHGLIEKREVDGGDDGDGPRG